MSKPASTKVYTPVGVSGSVTTTSGTSSAAIALPVGAAKVEITCTADANIIFGGSDVAAAVVATCTPLIGGREYVWDVLASVTHFRVIMTTAAGVLHVSAVG